jgi:alpha-glucosidase
MIGRPARVLLALLVGGVLVSAAPPIDRVIVTGPGATTRIVLLVRDGRLFYEVMRGRLPVIETSRSGIVVDGIDLGDGVTLGAIENYRVDDRSPMRGGHAVAIDRANGARVTVTHRVTGIRYGVEMRAYDDGVAFRTIVPGPGARVPDAAAAFTLPAGSLVWSHGLRDHYEAQYVKQRVDDVPAGEWAAPPITAKLPNNAGYVAITESNLRNYAGMVLQADGNRTYRERLAHVAPAGYPFTLRFGDAEAERLKTPAPVDGTITTPWRVVFVAPDLDTLVNSDLVHNLGAPPDKTLFPKGLATPWLKPGRAVWRYLDGGESSLEGIKEFSRLAGELTFEHHVVEGQWQKWSAEQLDDLVAFSRERGVGIWVWRHRNTLGDPVKRRELFAMLQKKGVVGVKVDFLDHEAKEVIDLYHAILRDAAEHQLMIAFHGSNKPAGESRTWPNEMTRESIYGLEHRRVESWGEFNTTFPFVRMLAGHADYTPVVFGERRKETSVAHQVASAVILTSPLLVYGGHPASLLSSPAVEMIMSIPSVWDETRVLPPSAIGEAAVFARRRGQRWFIAAMNGTAPRTVAIDLAVVKAGGEALIVRDNPDDPGAMVVETKKVRAGEKLEIPTRAAGGFVIRISGSSLP